MISPFLSGLTSLQSGSTCNSWLDSPLNPATGHLPGKLPLGVSFTLKHFVCMSYLRVTEIWSLSKGNIVSSSNGLKYWAEFLCRSLTRLSVSLDRWQYSEFYQPQMQLPSSGKNLSGSLLHLIHSCHTSQQCVLWFSDLLTLSFPGKRNIIKICTLGFYLSRNNDTCKFRFPCEHFY